MNAALLVVDAMLLASLAALTLSQPPEGYLARFSGRGGSGGRGGGSGSSLCTKLEVAWEALDEAVARQKQPIGKRAAGHWVGVLGAPACAVVGA